MAQVAGGRVTSSSGGSIAPASTPSAHTPFTLALLPWGDLIEDFLDEIGLSFEAFSSKMTGGWLFGYVAALQRHGARTAIFCVSGRVTSTLRTVHRPTGATLVILRAPAAYRALRRSMKDPYGCSVHAMFGATTRRSRPIWRAAHLLAPYLATPTFALAREVRRAGCSAILCQEYESPRFDTSILVGELLRIPVYATFQGGTWHRSGFERRLRPHTLRRSAGLIIGASIEAERVATQYGVPEGKVARVFNPLDLSEWRPVPQADARREFHIADTTRMAIWHGRIDIHRKGIDVLLQAWACVCAERPGSDLLLMLVGSGVDADALAREIQRTGVPRIRWIREYVLDKALLCRYLSAADVYVLPSRHEGFPVAPLEAMACGLPVIAASAPGVADIFDNGPASGGVVVPSDDPRALAEAIGRVLHDTNLARSLGVRARGRVEEAFGLDAVGAQLCKACGCRSSS